MPAPVCPLDHLVHARGELEGKEHSAAPLDLSTRAAPVPTHLESSPPVGQHTGESTSLPAIKQGGLLRREHVSEVTQKVVGDEESAGTTGQAAMKEEQVV